MTPEEKKRWNGLTRIVQKSAEDAKTAILQAQAAVSRIQSVDNAIQALTRAIRSSALKPLTNRERALASAIDMRPSYMVLSYDAADGGDAADTVSRQVDTVGRFIVDRIRASWYNDSGVQGLISSDQVGIVDHTSTNIVDFTWLVEDGRNHQYLANEEIPSSFLARGDGDGFPAGGLVLEGGSDVTMHFTPLRAWPSDGTLVFLLEGIQCFDQKGAP